MDDLAWMGFGFWWRLRVLRFAMLGYRRITYNVSMSKTRRNILGTCTAIKRRVQKLCCSSSWFKKSTRAYKSQECNGKRAPKLKVGRDQPTESVMFIPYTEESQLKKSLHEVDKNLKGYRSVRYVKTTGMTIEDSLVSKDPWAGSCPREDCFPCSTGKVWSSMIQGVAYRIDC